jgi:hypothetical protein
VTFPLGAVKLAGGLSNYFGYPKPAGAISDIYLLLKLARLPAAFQRRNSGEISFGRISGICGHTMMAASTTSIGTSMIIVSLSA